jgi:hypothetical protein
MWRYQVPLYREKIRAPEARLLWACRNKNNELVSGPRVSVWRLVSWNGLLGDGGGTREPRWCFMLPIARVSILITPTCLFEQHWTGVDMFCLFLHLFFAPHNNIYKWVELEIARVASHLCASKPRFGFVWADVGAGERLLSRALACCL